MIDTGNRASEAAGGVCLVGRGEHQGGRQGGGPGLPGANKRDVLNRSGKMPSLRKAGLPGSCNSPEQLGMSPSRHRPLIPGARKAWPLPLLAFMSHPAYGCWTDSSNRVASGGPKASGTASWTLGDNLSSRRSAQDATSGFLAPLRALIFLPAYNQTLAACTCARYKSGSGAIRRARLEKTPSDLASCFGRELHS